MAHERCCHAGCHRAPRERPKSARATQNGPEHNLVQGGGSGEPSANLSPAMLRLPISILCAACAAAAVAAPASIADPGTTGGVTAIEPPTLSPQGGLEGPRGETAAPPAQAAGARDGRPTSPGKARTDAGRAAQSTAQPETTTAPLAGAAAASQPSSPTAAPASSGGGGGSLPRTGFALAALVAVGTGFLLTGYALRYSKTLDG